MKGYQALPRERCGNCKHFCQHYRHEKGDRYVPLWLGHCVHPRVKNRRADEHCKHFTPAQEDQPDERGEE